MFLITPVISAFKILSKNIFSKIEFDTFALKSNRWFGTKFSLFCNNNSSKSSSLLISSFIDLERCDFDLGLKHC